MPHCKIEYSENIVENINFDKLFSKLHQLLVKDKLFNINHIKSRSIEHKNFFISSGEKNKCFVALTVSMLSGRTLETRQKLSQNLLEFLKEEFSESLQKLDCSLTVRIDEIEKESYSKFTSGS